jgi:signal transduction histidine kinase
MNTMLNRLRIFFAPPAFPNDEKKASQAAVLNTLLLSTLAFVLLDIFIATPFISAEKFFNALAAFLMLAVVALCFWLMRVGRVKLASVLYVSIVWVVFTLYMLFSNGLHSVMAVFYVAGTAIVSLLLGRKGGFINVAVCSLTGLVMILLEITGNSFPVIFPITPMASWINLTVALWMTATVLNLVMCRLNESLVLTQNRLEELSLAAVDKSRQVVHMRALFSIEQAILSSMDLNQVLTLLVREVIKQLHVDAAAVLLVNPQTQTLDYAAGEGFQTKALRYTRLEIGSGLAGRAAQELKTVYIADLTTIDNPMLLKSIAGEEFISYYGVPLFGKDRLQGVLEIFHSTPLGSDPEWLVFLETLAAQAAISIHNAGLLEAMQQSLKETNALYHISQSLASSLDPSQLMQDVVDLLYRDFGFYHVQIYLMDPASNSLVVGHGSGERGKLLQKDGFHLPVGTGIVGHVAAIGEPFTTNAVDQVLFFVRNPLLPDTQSEMVIPIKVEGHVLGVLDIQQSAPNSLTDRQMQLMAAVADQLAVALQKASLYAELQNSLRQEKSMRSQLIQSERLALIGRLLASVSHELNNPIQAIQNALFLIKEEESFSEQGRQDLEIVLSETERMATLIDRLRTTYRPTHSDGYQEIQLNEVIEYVHALTATHMRHSDIRFKFQPDPDLPPISGIPEQLRQVVLNLFMNAIEAMRTGGQLTVRTEQLPEQKKALLTFTDTGVGIDPKILPHIFEPFITDKDMGTGLGLTISYDIIHQHQGEIRAENNPQRGATFKVWLPVKGKG